MDDKTDIEVGFPFQLDSRGRAADPGYEQHIRDMMELVLFTNPGERVNRPEFGAGLLELLFSPETADTPGITQQLTRAALQRWLGDVVTIKALTVDTLDTRVDIRIVYEIPGFEEAKVATFELRDLPWNI